MPTGKDEIEFACVDHVNRMQDYYRSQHADHHLEKFIEVLKRVAEADAAAGRPSRFDIEDADFKAKRKRECLPVLKKAFLEICRRFRRSTSRLYFKSSLPIAATSMTCRNRRTNNRD